MANILIQFTQQYHFQRQSEFDKMQHLIRDECARDFIMELAEISKKRSLTFINLLGNS